MIRTCIVVAVVCLAGLLGLTARAQALSANSTAHCLGNIQDSAGNVIVDLGTVAAYTAVFPQNGAHQSQCVADVSAAASSWLGNVGQMCHAFFAASGGNLIFHYKLGSLSWRDSGTATTPSAYNYPQNCVNLSGDVFPSYYIITLIYSPPGCTPATTQTGYKCGSGSFVSYSSGSSTGSTVSVENSVGVNTSLTADLDKILTLGVSFAETSVSGSSVTISKTTGNTVKWPDPGPAGNDGIHHDYDQFFVLLNPAVAMSGWHDPVTGQNHVQWSLTTKNGAPARIQRVQVSYLRCALAGIGPRPGATGDGGNPSAYDPASCVANPFLQMQGPADASAPNGWLPGLTYDDYKQILAQDLFWNASPSNPILIPTARFVPQSTDFTYDQAGGPSGTSCATVTESISNTNTTTNTSSTQTQYQASMSLSANFPTAGLGLKSTTSFTWTNKTSSSLTNGNTQTASATVGCTSIGWTGVDFVTAYYDTLYGTFLFALDDGTGRARVLQGTITDVDGDHVPHQPLKLVVGNKTYQTASHNDGSFRFYLPLGQTSTGATTGTLTAGTVSKAVTVGPQATATAAIPTPTPSLSVAIGVAPVPPGPAPLPGNETARTATPATPAPTPTYVTVANRSLFARAKNVTITAVQAKSDKGSALVYSGKLPVVLPGGTALLAGSATTTPLTFTTATGPLSYLSVTVKADNLAAFTTVLIPTAANNTTMQQQ